MDIAGIKETYESYIRDAQEDQYDTVELPTSTAIEVYGAFDKMHRCFLDHGPEGRNYTNAEYVALRLKLEELQQSAIEDLRQIRQLQQENERLEKHIEKIERAGFV